MTFCKNVGISVKDNSKGPQGQTSLNKIYSNMILYCYISLIFIHTGWEREKQNNNIGDMTTKIRFCRFKHVRNDAIKFGPVQALWMDAIALLPLIHAH